MFSFGKANGPLPSVLILLDAYTGFIVDEHWTISVSA